MYTSYGRLFNTCRKNRGNALTDSTRFFPSTIEKVQVFEEVEIEVPNRDSCTSCNTPSKVLKNSVSKIASSNNDKGLDNILDPRFNLREAMKNCLLLEDHLFQPKRRCQDCISKHFSLIEAFLDEAITLDTNMKYYALTTKVQQQIKDAIRRYSLLKRSNRGLSDEDYCNLAQVIRVIRKPLCVEFACMV